jgi:tetratricopeptide (TPR) repeat protein
VNFVLEGSGQKYGDDIKLNVQLLDAVSERHIWSRPYQKKMLDIYSIQSEIAKDIAAELRAALSPEEISKIDRKPTENIEAYNLYLKGRHFLNRRTENDLKKSIGYFEEAIALDTTFALAYTSLAETYIVLGEWTFSQPDEVFPKAKKAAAMAIRLDNGSAEAHNAMAAIKRDYEWDWKGAEAEYLKAIELNPRYPTTYQWYAEFLSIMGRHTEAIENLKHALELDPLSPIIYTVGGRLIYPNARQYDIAIQQCRKALEIDSNYVLAHHSLAYMYYYKKMFTEAIAEANIVLDLSGWIGAKVLLVKVYAYSGRNEDAEIILDEIIKNRDNKYTSSTTMAVMYLALNRKEEALDLIEKAYVHREYNLIHIDASPDFDKFRDEPRFLAILKKMGFKE